MTTLEVTETVEFGELIISQNVTTVELIISQNVTTVEILPYDIVGMVQETVLKEIVAGSTDFNDFKAKIAAL